MTVGTSSCGRKGDETGDSAASPLAERRRAPSGRSSTAAAVHQGGSRFWALAGESSDEEEDDLAQLEVPESPVPSRSGPSPVCLGDFLDSAWSRVGNARSRGGRRRAWAPGGRGSRFRAAAGAANARPLGALGGTVVAKASQIRSRPVAWRAPAWRQVWLIGRRRAAVRSGRRRPHRQSTLRRRQFRWSPAWWARDRRTPVSPSPVPLA
jgi:hypothetical protein